MAGNATCEISEQWNNSFKTLLDKYFARETVETLKSETEKNEEVMVAYISKTKGKTGNSIAVAVFQETEEAIYILAVYTPKNERHCGRFKMILNKLKEFKKTLFLETEKFSMNHAVFERLGFMPASNEEVECFQEESVLKIIEEGAILLRFQKPHPNFLKADLEKYDVKKQWEKAKEAINKLSAMSFGVETIVKHEIDYDDKILSGHFSLIESDADIWEKVKRQHPELVVQSLSHVVEQLGGKVFLKWLKFVAYKGRLHISNGSQVDEEIANFNRDFVGAKLETQVLEDVLSEYDVRQLGVYHKDTEIQFLLLVLAPEGSGDKWALKCMKTDGGLPCADNVTKVYVWVSRGNDNDPKFVCAAPGIQERCQVLSSNPENPEIAKTVLPPPTCLQLVNFCVPPDYDYRKVVLGAPSSQTALVPPLSNGQLDSLFTDDGNLKKENVHQLFLYNVENAAICPVLAAISSGIAVSNNGDDLSLCHIPMPRINRKLTPHRLALLQETLVQELSSMNTLGLQENFKFFPYTMQTGAPDAESTFLIDPTACEITGNLVGRPYTTGLTQDSVKALWKAFFEGDPVTINDRPDGGMVVLVGKMLSVIQKQFNSFQERKDLEHLLVHLFKLWKEKHEESTLEANKLLCWGINQQTLLLIKVLWVELGFPLLAPVEGLARLHAANAVLLKLGTTNRLPSGVTTSGNFQTSFLGITKGCTLNEETRRILTVTALEGQERSTRATDASLRDLFPDFCRAMKIDVTELDKYKVFQPNAGLTNLKELLQQQSSKLIKLIQGYQKTLRFLEDHLKPKAANADKKADWRYIIGTWKTPDTWNDKHRTAVVIFNLVLAPFHVKWDGVDCKSPFETTYNLVTTNGARETSTAIWWIPDATVRESREAYCGWVVEFKKCALVPLVESMAACIVTFQGGKLGIDTVYMAFLKTWLQSYLRELMHWKGILLDLPEVYSNEKLEKVVSLLKAKLHIEKTEKKRGLLSCAEIMLQESQGKPLHTNLFGVVMVTFLHLTLERELSCVEPFPESREQESSESLLKYCCPLFLARDKDGKKIDGNKTWSLFKLSQWLLSAKGLNALTNLEERLDVLEVEGEMEMFKGFCTSGHLGNDSVYHSLEDAALTFKARFASKETTVVKKMLKYQHGFQLADCFQMCHEEGTHDGYSLPTVWDRTLGKIEAYRFPLGGFLVNIPKKDLTCLQHQLSPSDAIEYKRLCDLRDTVGSEVSEKWSFLSDCYQSPSAPQKGSFNFFFERFWKALRKLDNKKFKANLSCKAFGRFTPNGDPPSGIEEVEESLTAKSNEGDGFLAVLSLDKEGYIMYIQNKTDDGCVLPSFYYIPFGFAYVFSANQERGGAFPVDKSGAIFHFVFANAASNGSDPRFGLVNTICKRDDFPFESDAILAEAKNMYDKYLLEESDLNVAVKERNVAQASEVEYNPKENSVSISTIEEEKGLGNWISYSIPFLPVKLFATAIIAMEHFLKTPHQFEDIAKPEALRVFELESCVALERTFNCFQITNPGRPADSENRQDIEQDFTNPRLMFFQLFDRIAEKLDLLLKDPGARLKVADMRLFGSATKEEPLKQELPYNTSNLHLVKNDQVKDGTRHAYYCIIPMTPKGCNIRVAILKAEALTTFKAGETKWVKVTDKDENDENENNIPVLFETQERGILAAHNCVHVPFGAALLLDAREPVGGINIQTGHLTLVSTLANVGENTSDNEEGTEEGTVFLRRFLSYPDHSFENASKGEKDDSREDYEKALGKVLQENMPRNDKRMRLTFDVDDETFGEKGAVATFVRSAEQDWHCVYATPRTAIVSKGKMGLSIQATKENKSIHQTPKNPDFFSVVLGRSTPIYRSRELFLLRDSHAKFGELSTAANAVEATKNKVASKDPPHVNYDQIIQQVVKFGTKNDDTGAYILSPLDTQGALENEFNCLLRWAARLLWGCANDNLYQLAAKSSQPAQKLMQALKFGKGKSKRVGFKNCGVCLYKVPANNALCEFKCGEASDDSEFTAHLFISLGVGEEEVKTGDTEESNEEEPPRKKQKTSELVQDDGSDGSGSDGENENDKCQNDGYIYKESDEEESLYFLVIHFAK